MLQKSNCAFSAISHSFFFLLGLREVNYYVGKGKFGCQKIYWKLLVKCSSMPSVTFKKTSRFL